MKTSDIVVGEVYAERNHPSSFGVYPVLALAKEFWRVEYRLEGMVKVRKAVPGVKAGTMKGFSYGCSTAVGIPVLHFAVEIWKFWESTQRRISSDMNVKEILGKARDEMGVLGVVAADREGQPIKKSEIDLMVEMAMADGSTDEFGVYLKVLRPQQIIGAWAEQVIALEKEHFEAGRRIKREERIFAEKRATGLDIMSRVENITGLGSAHAFYQGTTDQFVVSRELLTKLVEAAEKGSAQ